MLYYVCIILKLKIPKCLSNLANFNLLFLHFKVFYVNNITFYKCLEDNCLRSFSSLNSFKKHVKCHINSSPIWCELLARDINDGPERDNIIRYKL